MKKVCIENAFDEYYHKHGTGDWNGETFPIKEVKAFKVDGINIKADTYYKLLNGTAVEVK